MPRKKKVVIISDENILLIFEVFYIELINFWLLDRKKTNNINHQKETQLTPAFLYALLNKAKINISQRKLLSLWKIFVCRLPQIQKEYIQYIKPAGKGISNKLFTYYNNNEIFEPNMKDIQSKKLKGIKITEEKNREKDEDIVYSGENTLTTSLKRISSSNSGILLKLFQLSLSSIATIELQEKHRWIPQLIFLLGIENIADIKKVKIFIKTFGKKHDITFDLTDREIKKLIINDYKDTIFIEGMEEKMLIQTWWKISQYGFNINLEFINQIFITFEKDIQNIFLYKK